MADDNDDLTITLEQDGSVEKTVDKAPQSDDAGAALEAQLRELERERDRLQAASQTDRVRADQAEQEAQRARQEASQAQTEIADSRLGSIEAGLVAATTARDAAKSAYTSAMESGNWKEAAEAQERLATAAARIERLNEAKDEVEVRRAAEPKPRGSAEDEGVRREAARSAPPTDPVEAFIASRKPKTAQWLRDHPDHASAIGLYAAGRATSEQKKIALKLTAADNDAQAAGYDPETPEYFAHVETFMGLKKADGTNGKAAPQTQQRRRSMPAAPVQASSGGTNGGAVQVRLTKGQRDAATDGTIVWGQHDLTAGRIKDKALVGQAIGVQEMARRVHQMDQERPGIFIYGDVDQ